MINLSGKGVEIGAMHPPPPHTQYKLIFNKVNLYVDLKHV